MHPPDILVRLRRLDGDLRGLRSRVRGSIGNPGILKPPSIAGKDPGESDFSSTAWLLAERIARLGAGIVVNLIAARIFAPSQYGILSWAVAWMAILSPLLTQGLESIVPREFIGAPSRQSRILGGAVLLKGFGLLATIAIVLGVALSIGDASPRRLAILVILTAGQLFQSLDLFEYGFIARQSRRTPAMIRTASTFGFASAKLALLAWHPNLVLFTLIVSLEIAIPVVAIMLAGRRFDSAPSFEDCIDEARRLGSETTWSLVSAFATMVFLRVDQILVDHLLGSESLGIYSVAVKLGEMCYFLPIAMTVAAFPGLVRDRRESDERFRSNYVRLGRRTIGYGALSAALVGFVGPLVLRFALDESYAGASAILAIYAWSIVPLAANQCVGKWLVIHRLTRLLAMFQLAGAVSNLGGNLLVIPVYGLEGAAWTTVVSYAFSSILLPLAHPASRAAILSLIRPTDGESHGSTDETGPEQ